MLAGIDVGSNTVRLLIGESDGRQVTPFRYERRITRLAGGYGEEKGLSPESMERTLSALGELTTIARDIGVSQLRAVGTQALRQACNRQTFIDEVHKTCGLDIDVVTGAEEARLSMAGILAALDPVPETCLGFDIGGASTEFIFYHQEQIQLTISFPLGVVRLVEHFATIDERLIAIGEFVEELETELKQAGILDAVRHDDCVLVGTAGTVTTLAALCLGLVRYDWRRVNNFRLPRLYLQDLARRLALLSPVQRERLPGMEAGRGDLIEPGLQLVLALLKSFAKTDVLVSDFGLLEGLLLDLCRL